MKGGSSNKSARVGNIYDNSSWLLTGTLGMVDYEAMLSSIGNTPTVSNCSVSASDWKQSSDEGAFCELRKCLLESEDGECGISLSCRDVKVVRTASEPIMIQRMPSSEPSTPTPANSLDTVCD